MADKPHAVESLFTNKSSRYSTPLATPASRHALGTFESHHEPSCSHQLAPERTAPLTSNRRVPPAVTHENNPKRLKVSSPLWTMDQTNNCHDLLNDRRETPNDVGISPTSLVKSAVLASNDSLGKVTDVVAPRRPLDVVIHREKARRVLQTHRYWEGFERREVVLLLMQALDSLGYRSSRKILELESSIPLENKATRQLHRAVLSGGWTKVLNLIDSLSCLSPTARHWIRFMVLEYNYFGINLLALIKGAITTYPVIILGCFASERLCDRNFTGALTILRQQLYPNSLFHSNATKRAHYLVSLLLYTEPDYFQQEVGWTPCRHTLWDQICQVFPSSVFIPRKRFATLLHEAVRFEELCCVYHTDVLRSPNLLKSHICTEKQLPTTLLATLESDFKDIWSLAVSGDGMSLAAGSSDDHLLLWRLKGRAWNLEKNVSIYGYGGLTTLAWNSDSTFLAGSFLSGLVRIWRRADTFPEVCSIETIESRGPQDRHFATGLVWIPHSQQLVVSPGNRTLSLVQLEPNDPEDDKNLFHATVLDIWRFRVGIQDLALNACANILVVCMTDKTIRLLPVSNTTDGQENYATQSTIVEIGIATAVCSSRLTSQFLVSILEDQPVLRLWDAASRQLLQTYQGHRLNCHIFKPCFAGATEEFIVCGSADKLIYIWNKLYGSILRTIRGHALPVTVVCWSPRLNWLFSGSSDTRVCIWGYEESCPLEQSEPRGSLVDDYI